MKLSMLLWTLNQGIKNIIRNKLISLISMLTMSVSIFLFSLFLILFLNFESTLSHLQRDICITVFFDEEIDSEGIKRVGEEILKNENVDRMEYVSSSDAWADFLEDYFDNDEEIRELFKEDNPLQNSSSYTVYLRDIAGQSELAEYIRGIQGVRQVNESVKLARLFRDLKSVTGSVSIFIMSVLVCVSVFLIGSTITQGIIKRKNEIRIMKFCGATELMIRGQFVMEGLIIGILGSCIPLTVIMLLYKKARAFLEANYSILEHYINLVSMETAFRYLIPSVLAIGIGIGYIGSRLAMHKYLKV